MTNWIEKSIVPAAAALAITMATAGPAGIPAPHPMRIAVLGGVEGLVYYSVVEGGYRRVTVLQPGDMTERMATLETEQN